MRGLRSCSAFFAFFDLVLLVTLVGCKPEPGPFTADQVLGGVLVPMATLNHGARFYGLHCAGCHGRAGDGRGEVSPTQLPKPRDLRLGTIKFGSTRGGQLPTDDDLKRILRGGLRGTGMQPWRFRDQEVDALVAFIKTLSPRWRTEQAGEPVAMAADPWGGATAAARARGAALFAGKGRCAQCHSLGGGEVPEHRDSPSLYGTLTAPDLRTGVRRSGDSPHDLYRVIAAGVGGTAMGQAVDTLSPEDLWALVHFVASSGQS